MNLYSEVYELNKKLDHEFDLLYDINSPEIRSKNILELLVEIGECANETRVFKYWSQKPPSEDEIILAELADCLIMVLSFANLSNLNLDEVSLTKSNLNVVDEFIQIYKLASSLTIQFDADLIKKLLNEIINLGHLLGYDDEIICKSCLEKINRNFKRFEHNFTD